MELATEIDEFALKLNWFIDVNKIPRSWLSQLDIVNYTATGPKKFEEKVKEINTRKEKMAVRATEHFSVVAKVTGWLAVKGLGYPKWLAIDEVPEDSPEILNGVHSADFFYPSLGEAVRVLSWKKVPYIIEPNDHYMSVRIPFGDDESCVINSLPIDQIVNRQISDEELKLLA